MEEFKQTKTQKMKRFGTECKRVITVTKKPDKTEFLSVVKVTGIGILVIGALGFVLTMLKELLL
jgi:protein transport protein SEC61 subunit gamma-like protein